MQSKLAQKLIKKLYKIYPHIKHLLSKDWQQRINKDDHPSKGFCYIAAEALFYLLDRKPKVYVASYFDKEGRKSTHWFLKHENLVLDPTAEQYYNTGEAPPYHAGKPAGFLTKEPSKRCQILMNMLRLS